MQNADISILSFPSSRKLIQAQTPLTARQKPLSYDLPVVYIAKRMLNSEVIVVEYFHSEYSYINIYTSLLVGKGLVFNVKIILNMHYYQLTLS